jgi:hypothetical protein
VSEGRGPQGSCHVEAAEAIGDAFDGTLYRALATHIEFVACASSAKLVSDVIRWNGCACCSRVEGDASEVKRRTIVETA